jgi:hypothetical protein
MEEFKREKGEPQDVLAARIIRTRAQGRCEHEWYEGLTKHRCRELHGEQALSFKGVVHLTPMPINGLKSSRVADFRVLCQRHAYQMLERITQSITAGVSGIKRSCETNNCQTSLL